jgi:hypothetical protein
MQTTNGDYFPVEYFHLEATTDEPVELLYKKDVMKSFPYATLIDFRVEEHTLPCLHHLLYRQATV